MDDGMGVGRTVGWLYAVSTFGSFLGTVLTGFILIPSLGVNNIIYLSALVLVALSAGYWVFFRKKALAAALIALPVLFFLAPEELPSVVRPDGTKVSIISARDSAYGQIKIVDYSYGGVTLREFLLENMIQGAIDVNTGLSISKYTYYSEQIAMGYKPDSRRALVIGLGSGIVPKRFASHGIKTDVVEIDPGVVDAAAKYFSYDPLTHDTYIEDGRYFLKSPGDDYDIIFLDAFSGDTPPSHLVSVEAFELMKKRLSRDGILIMNFIGENRASNPIVPSMVQNTLKRVFRHVDIYTSPGYFSETPHVLNMIFVAFDDERAVNTGFLPDNVYPPIVQDLKGLYSRKVSLKQADLVFTDDYNPIDFYDIETRELFRKTVISNTDRAIFIY